MTDIFVGIDFGGMNLKIGCFDRQLNLLAATSVPADIKKGPQGVIEQIGTVTAELINGCDHNMSDLVAAGIGTPGVVDTEKGAVLASSNIGFTNVPLRDMVSKHLKIPVILENDANMTCWAEHAAGAGKGTNEMALVTLGTGIGGGIITNGELIRGFDSNGGEIGHIIIQPGGRFCGCGQKGCVEAYSSASATAARATEAVNDGQKSTLQAVLAQNGQITCKDVYEHSAAGDELAQNITDQTAQGLAVLCINLLHICGPEKIVFYGGMIAAGDILLDGIKKFFHSHIWNIKAEKLELCFAELGADAGIIGAGALACDETKKGRLA